jgi:uncharacterized protein (TIGR02145 family)
MLTTNPTKQFGAVLKSLGSVLGSGLLGLVLLTVVALLTSISPSTYALPTTSLDSDLELEIESALMMSLANCDNPLNSTPVSIDIYPISGNGYGANCQDVTISTNAPGYTFLVKAKSIDPDTTLTSNSLFLVGATSITPHPAIPAMSSSATPLLPTTLGTNTWGFAVENLHNFYSNFDTTYSINPSNIPVNHFANMPITNTTLASTTSPTNADYYRFYYAARLDATIPPGTYEADVIYTAVGEVVPEPPGYESDPPSNYVTKTTAIVPNFASTRAPSGNGIGTNGPQFSIVGSGFGGSPTVTIGGQPCTSVVVNSAGTAITCTGPVSGVSGGEQRVTINNVDAGNNYTVWYSSYNFPTLQGLNQTACNALPLETPTIFRDTRDSQLYYVSKLKKDSAGTTFWCWMTDNLRYKPNGDTTGTVTSSFSATQVWTGYLTGDGTNAGTSGTTTDNLDSGKYIDPIISTGGSNFCRSTTSNPLMPANNISKCGLLYNFYTATAGTTPQSQYTGSPPYQQGYTASGSICPANWHLPTGYNASGDFGVLDIAYGGNGASRTGLTDQSVDPLNSLWREKWPWQGLFSGGYTNSFSGQGTNVSYWPSSVVNATSGYVLYFNSTTIYPGASGTNRYYGVAIRCVL